MTALESISKTRAFKEVHSDSDKNEEGQKGARAGTKFPAMPHNMEKWGWGKRTATKNVTWVLKTWRPLGRWPITLLPLLWRLCSLPAHPLCIFWANSVKEPWFVTVKHMWKYLRKKSPSEWKGRASQWESAASLALSGPPCWDSDRHCSLALATLRMKACHREVERVHFLCAIGKQSHQHRRWDLPFSFNLRKNSLFHFSQFCLASCYLQLNSLFTGTAKLL